MKISSQFDSGSIEVLSIDPAGQARLQLRKDVVSDRAVDIRQWFHFRLQGARGKAVDLCIENASRATFPGGWPGYRACASYDRSSWFRVPTTYVDGQLTISHTPQRDSIYYAYFEPYSWERHLQLLGRADASKLARVVDLGSTPEGRDMNVIEIASRRSGASNHCWIIARQHPGETMAEWLVEGLMDRLLDENDTVSTQLLAETTFHIVPNMNPDGSVHGNLPRQHHRRQPQSPMDDAIHGAQPGSAVRARRHGTHRLRFLSGCSRRRNDSTRVRGRLRDAANHHAAAERRAG